MCETTCSSRGSRENGRSPEARRLSRSENDASVVDAKGWNKETASGAKLEMPGAVRLQKQRLCQKLLAQLKLQVSPHSFVEVTTCFV